MGRLGTNVLSSPNVPSSWSLRSDITGRSKTLHITKGSNSRGQQGLTQDFSSLKPYKKPRHASICKDVPARMDNLLCRPRLTNRLRPTKPGLRSPNYPFRVLIRERRPSFFAKKEPASMRGLAKGTGIRGWERLGFCGSNAGG
jgi:hypothetical protein